MEGCHSRKRVRGKQGTISLLGKNSDKDHIKPWEAGLEPGRSRFM